MRSATFGPIWAILPAILLAGIVSVSIGTVAVADSQRILGRWTNGWWYPARVGGVRGDVYDLVFEDGDRLSVHADGIGRFDWRAGSQIHCRPGGSGGYRDATVAMVNGAQVMVGYGGGAHETTGVHNCRSRTAGAFAARTGYARNQPVLAQWSNGWWYAARISGWNSEVYHVAFEDGDTANLRPNRISGHVWRPGSRVQCKWRGGDTYYDGVIAARNGTAVRVHYDDGDREDTYLAYCRSKTATGRVAGQPGDAGGAQTPGGGEDLVGTILDIIGDGIVEGLTEGGAAPAPQPKYGPTPGYSVPGSVYDSARDVPNSPDAFLKAIEDNTR
jgi:hypothetical protein